MGPVQFWLVTRGAGVGWLVMWGVREGSLGTRGTGVCCTVTMNAGCRWLVTGGEEEACPDTREAGHNRSRSERIACHESYGGKRLDVL